MTDSDPLMMDPAERRDLSARIRGLCARRRVRPAPMEARLLPLRGFRVLLCDVYGTLLSAGRGDIAADGGAGGAVVYRAALRAAGLGVIGGGTAIDWPRPLDAAIAREHARLRAAGIATPEVRIDEIWAGLLGVANGPAIRRLAVEYELRVNPVWPMPGAAAAVRSWRARGRLCGLISNAQFYTPLTLSAFRGMGGPARWAPDLCAWSYVERRAKPGRGLFETIRTALRRRGIAPAEALYVGNDLIKDIRPARAVGFRTVLFAGDAGSLRLGDGDPAEADAVVTDWRQLRV